jgi:hypothetical protein
MGHSVVPETPTDDPDTVTVTGHGWGIVRTMARQIFSSTAELDAYLDDMQKKVQNEEG